MQNDMIKGLVGIALWLVFSTGDVWGACGPFTPSLPSFTHPVINDTTVSTIIHDNGIYQCATGPAMAASSRTITIFPGETANFTIRIQNTCPEPFLVLPNVVLYESVNSSADEVCGGAMAITDITDTTTDATYTVTKGEGQYKYSARAIASSLPAPPSSLGGTSFRTPASVINVDVIVNAIPGNIPSVSALPSTLLSSSTQSFIISWPKPVSGIGGSSPSSGSSHALTYKVYRDSTSGSPVYTGPLLSYSVPASNLSPGTHTYYVKACYTYQGDEKCGGLKSTTVKVTEAPVIESISHVSSGSSVQDSWTLKAKVTDSYDDGQGIEPSVKFTVAPAVGSAYTKTITSGDSTGTYSLTSWQPTVAGSYTVTVEATDSDGVVTTSSGSYTVAVAGQPIPTATVYSISDIGITDHANQPPINIVVRGLDTLPGGDIEQLELWVKKGTNGTPSRVGNAVPVVGQPGITITDTTPNMIQKETTIQWPNGAVITPGDYYFAAQSFDNGFGGSPSDSSGLTWSDTIVTVQAHGTPPSVDLHYEDDTGISKTGFKLGDPINLVATINPDASDITSVRFVCDSNEIASLTSPDTAGGSTYTYRWTGATLSTGQCQAFINYSRFDFAGDEQSSALETLSVANNAPPTARVLGISKDNSDFSNRGTLGNPILSRVGDPLYIKFEAVDSDGVINPTSIVISQNGSPINSNGADIEHISGNDYVLTWASPPETPTNTPISVYVEDDDGLNNGVANSADLGFIFIRPKQAPDASSLVIDVADHVGNPLSHPIAVDRFTYTVSWNTVPNADLDKYELHETFNSVTTQLVLSANATSKVIPFSGNVTRENGTYSYFVRACNDQGCNDSSSINVTVNLPTPSTAGFTNVTPMNVAGKYTLNWNASSDLSATRFELQEKDALANGGNAPFVNITLDTATYGPMPLLAEFPATHPSGRYIYQLRTCNQHGCGAFGPQLPVTILPPYINDAEVCPSGDCVTIDASYTAYDDTDLNSRASVTLTAISDSTITQTFSGHQLNWVISPTAATVQIDLTPGSALHTELSNLGVRVTVTNPNGDTANTNVYAAAKETYLKLNEAAPVIGLDGTVYVSSGNDLYALDPATGQVLSGWPFQTADEIKSAPALGPDGTLYFGSKDDNVYAVYPADHAAAATSKWPPFTTAGDILSSPVLDGSDTLYVGSMDHWLYALHTNNGGLRWKFQVDSGIADTPVLGADGSIYVTTIDGNVHVVNRGNLGPNVLVWESMDDSLLATDMSDVGWLPEITEASYLLQVGRAYRGLLQPPLSLSLKHLNFWTYALVQGASMEEVVDAFLNSDTGKLNFPQSQTHAEFIQALFDRFFPGGETQFTVGTTPYDANSLLVLMNAGSSRASIALLFADSMDYSTTANPSLYYAVQHMYGFCVAQTLGECDVAGIDPALLDSDNDNLPDWWEIFFFGGLDVAKGDDTVVGPGSGDVDGNGVSNRQAYDVGGDPCALLCTSIKTPLPPHIATSPGVSAASESVGAITGNFRVNESGSATYSIPVFAPAGIAGVTPQISLNYDSQGGNGLLGKGWSLGGLSGITRCRQTQSQDGAVSPVSWNTQDRFCLDGQRLVPEDPNAGHSDTDTTYRTEIDSFVVVTAVGGIDGSPSYFTAVRKDGSVSEYGNTPSSQLKTSDDNHVLSWAINQFADSVGNTITFSYRSDSLGQRIDRITYAEGNAYLQFTYQEGSRPDPLGGYVSGYEFKTDALLTRIDVQNNSGKGLQEVRHYDLTYNTSTVDKQISYLDEITECVNAVCIQPTTFTWAGPQEGEVYSYYVDGQLVPAPAALGLGFEVQPSAAIDLTDQKDQIAIHRILDINGDGQMDVVWLMPDFDKDEKIHDHYLDYAISDGTRLVPEPVTTPKYHDTGNGYKPLKLDVLDYNADGRQDVAIYDYSGQWNILLAEPFGNTWRLSATPLTTPDIQGVLTEKETRFIDINGDGLVDALTDDKYYLLTSGAENERSSNHYYRFAPGEDLTWNWNGLDEAWDLSDPRDEVVRYFLPGSGDFDGDGAVDLIAVEAKLNWETLFGEYIAEEQLRVYAVRLQSETGTIDVIKRLDTGTFTEICRDKVKYCRTEERFRDREYSQGFRAVDLNGDGLSDIVHRVDDTYSFLLNTGGQFAAPVTIGTLPDKVKPNYADYDLDGYPDFIWYEAGELHARLWRPRDKGFDPAVVDIMPVFATTNDSHMFVDMNGDAALDYLHFDTTNYVLTTYPSTGGKGPRQVITQIDNGMGMLTDVVYGALTNSGRYHRIDSTAPGTVPSYCADYPAGLAERIHCMLFVKTTSSDFYSELNSDWVLPDENHHTLGKTDPVLELMAPAYVVTDVLSTAPATADDSMAMGGVQSSAQSSISYFYGEGKIAASGRGLLGFKEITSIDRQTKVETTTTYRQDFPFIGHPLKTEVITADGLLLSSATNIWQLQGCTATAGHLSCNGGEPTAPYRPVLQQSVEVSYDFNALVKTPLSTVTTTNDHDRYGNVLDAFMTTVDHTTGSTFSQHTENTYNDTGLLPAGYSALMGRLTEAKVTHSRTGTNDRVRVSQFDYFDSGSKKGLLRTESVMRDSAGTAVLLETEYDYHPNGNKAWVKVKGNAGPNGTVAQERETRWHYDGTQSRYLASTYNSNNHLLESITERDAYGQPTKVVDLFGNETTIAYDRFGREYFKSNNTGGSSYSVLGAGSYTGAAISINCPAQTRSHVITHSVDGGKTLACLDALSREIYSAKLGFNGQWWAVKTEYDSLGRIKHKTVPHVEGDPAPFSTMTYDDLGRVTEVVHPDGSISRTDYSGLTTIATNGLFQTKTEVKNALGELIDVTDDELGTIAYAYDAAGNLTTTTTDGPFKATGVSGAITVSMEYDNQGRKKRMNDPDKGHWEYDYNDFGELIEQRDAKGQKTTMAYDVLGAMIQRTDYDAAGSIQSTTNWDFNPTNDLLATITHNSHEGCVSSTHLTELFYDGYGRADYSDITIDGVKYTERTTYDQYGRVFQQFDASGNNKGIEYGYNAYGYLQTQSEALIVNGSQALYVEYQNMDAWGNVTQEYLGNGLTTGRIYNPETGRLENIVTAVSGMPAVQDLQMHYDVLGNLIEKTNFRQETIETYCYDDLNRLVGTAIGGACGTDLYHYDSFGNITKKEAVADYQYGSGNVTGTANDAGPHAVTRADGINYYYDDNGNMTSDDNGRALSYTVFDKAYQISKGADINIAFRYGPDRARYRRVDTKAGVTATTHYVGNVEFINKAVGDEVKRYIGGRLVVIDKDHPTNSALQSWTEQYLLKDHLGSVDVIVGPSGGQSETDQAVSFDAWGQRRDADDLETLISEGSLLEPILALTNRGFTGHEMLDTVGLIHMNGRIYDAKLGRFIQADPQIDGVTNTQGYNRYSYVHNNPLSYTDPSGYGASNKIWTGVKIVIAVILTFACEGGCAPQAWAWALGSASAHQAANQGGSPGQIAIAGFSGAAMGYLGGAYGADTLGLTEFVGWSALAGGITAELQGGKFGHGFIAAGVGAAAGSISLGNVEGPLAALGRTLARSVIGGTVSKVTGGKFANGAAYAAFSSILNEAAAGNFSSGKNNGIQESPEATSEASVSVDDSTFYFNETEARAAADAKVEALKTNLPGEHAVFTVEKNGAYYNTHPVSSGGAHSVNPSFDSIIDITTQGYRWVGFHHNHPTIPFISGGSRGDLVYAGMLDTINGGGVMSSVNPVRVSINYNGSISWANRYSQPATRRQINRRGYNTDGQLGNLFIGKPCTNYACN